MKNIAVFSEKTDVPHLPNQYMVAISVVKLWPWKLGEDPSRWNWYTSWNNVGRVFVCIYILTQVSDTQVYGQHQRWLS